MKRIGLIGCGYWGPNLIRNFMALKDAWISDVCDLDEKELEKIGKRYPSLRLTAKPKDILESAEIDAVVIATPVMTHFSLAKEALERRKHVLVEKPLATSVAQARQLMEIAEKNKLCLMVDHTFIYSEPVRILKEHVKDLGELHYFDSVRVNLGLFQQDINVLWDLAPHDLSILLHLIDEDPLEVSAVGIGHINPEIENTAYMVLKFKNVFIAHFHFNWLSPVKIRSTLVAGSKRMLVYDDLNPLEQVKIYDYGVVKSENKSASLVDYRTGDVHSPHVPKIEALHHVCNDFVQSMIKGSKPVSDGAFGLRVVRVLEAAQHSIKNGGRFFRLDDGS